MLGVVRVWLGIEAAINDDHWGVCFDPVVLLLPGRAVRGLLTELSCNISIQGLGPRSDILCVIFVQDFFGDVCRIFDLGRVARLQ